MIDFDTTVAKSATFDTMSESRKWVTTIIAELVDLKRSPGGGLRCKNLLRHIVEPFHHKGKGDYLKEIEGYIREEENNRTEAKFDAATKDKQRERLETNENGSVTANLANLVMILSNNKFIEFQYDTFSEQRLFRFTGEPLWNEGLIKSYFEITYPQEHDITGSKTNRWYQVDGHIDEIKLYLHQFFPDERKWFELDDAVNIVSKRNQINIYVDWMDHGLPEWDGIDRMDFLYRHAGVENKDWAKVIGHLLILPIVARCYQPGFDYRGFVILEGDEDIGKSWLTKTLPFPFDESHYTPFVFNNKTESYEPARQLRSVIVAELAEKGGMDNKGYDQVKAFLTYTVDVNRRMNSNNVERLKRINIFIITCNESIAYLKGDIDGDSRFYPVRCNGKINVIAILRELPQLYAQAKYLWEMEVSVRPTPAEIEMQREFIKPRQMKSNYYYWVLDQLKFHRNQMIHEWDDGFTMEEMLDWCKQESWFAGNPRTYHRRQISDILRNHFFINNDKTKAVPVFYQKEGGPKVSRKWRYQGSIDWNLFIDSLED